MANVLYLRKMGMDDDTIKTDVKNHRVRVLENIDIIYKGKNTICFSNSRMEHTAVIEQPTNGLVHRLKKLLRKLY